jgi:hypothetical protein
MVEGNQVDFLDYYPRLQIWNPNLNGIDLQSWTMKKKMIHFLVAVDCAFVVYCRDSKTFQKL